MLDGSPNGTITRLNARKTSATHYSYEVEDLGIKIMQITFEHVKNNVVHYSLIDQLAIGDEGPWADLKGITAKTHAKQIELQPGGELCPPNGSEACAPKAEEQPPFKTSQYLVDQATQAAERRWLPLTKHCLNADGTINPAGPCYTYRSTDEYRFEGEDGKVYYLTITYPGGC